MPKGAGKKDAERKEVELEKSVESVEFINGDPPLTEIMALYMTHADSLRSPETAKQHAERIAPYIAGKKASEAKTCATRMINDLSSTLRPATINKSLSTLKMALTLAYDNEIISSNYGERIKRLQENNARHVVLTIEQVKTIADKASANVRAAIWIAIYTGMRRGEILKMQKEHISGDMITIPAGNTKTFKMRSVPIIEPAREWLEYIPLPINFEGLKTGFQRARKAAGMEHANFHDLRRSCGTLMVQAGVDLYVVSKVLGHSSVSVTQKVYAHLKTEQLRDGLNKAFL